MPRPAAPLSASETSCRKVTCPDCCAIPGQPCITVSLRPLRIVHFARRERAVELGHHAP